MRRISSTRIFAWLAGALLLAGLAVSSGCSRTNAAGAQQMAPPVVEVVPVEQRDVPVYHEWIGTLDGMVNAAIKAEVTGYLQTQNYTEGSFVKKGQLLFQIDPRPFQAAVDQSEAQLAQANGQLTEAKAQVVQAQAQLAQAQANQVRTQLDVDRYEPLAKQQAITQQDLDNATQNNISARAQVEAAKARVETAKAQIEASRAAVQAAGAAVEAARVNLGFTRLTSPIDGIAGQAQVQVGNLVSPAGGPDHHGLHPGTDQGEFHGQRAGIPQLHAAYTGRDETFAARADSGRRYGISAQRKVPLRRPAGEPGHGRHPFDRIVSESRKYSAPRPVRQSPRRGRNQGERTAGPAARRDGVAGQLSGCGSQPRPEGLHRERQSRRPRRIAVDDQ